MHNAWNRRSVCILDAEAKVSVTRTSAMHINEGCMRFAGYFDGELGDDRWWEELSGPVAPQPSPRAPDAHPSEAPALPSAESSPDEGEMHGSDTGPEGQVPQAPPSKSSAGKTPGASVLASSGEKSDIATHLSRGRKRKCTNVAESDNEHVESSGKQLGAEVDAGAQGGPAAVNEQPRGTSGLDPQPAHTPENTILTDQLPRIVTAVGSVASQMTTVETVRRTGQDKIDQLDYDNRQLRDRVSRLERLISRRPESDHRAGTDERDVKPIIRGPGGEGPAKRIR
ncbi:hypothetical protein EVG20_g11310 [Dentipellis fragilis]|uniref:Uncharacterized protein n=1 Tax=Dentipellis fragilis TaxID=205917 RepID=A0A4Y9XM56_9AGAM|nr:hypothetical protein EVG20_g11310 [Dentipellis fragilis]